MSGWAERAALAERAVVDRHLRSLFGLPGTELGVVSWPAPWTHRWWLEWHYWWQAHLIDCLVDAHLRSPAPSRVARLGRVVRSHRLRNLTGWTNRYYDDMAWLALALERAGRHAGVARPRALDTLTRQLLTHWHPRETAPDGTVLHVGGLPWRRGSDFFNAPANGPAAILLARRGRVSRAGEMAQWMHDVLVDPVTGLVRDGIRADGSLVETAYSYCQGVVLGVEVELAVRTSDRVHGDRVCALVEAIGAHLCADHVLTTGGGGDGGLFNGILARHLAGVATELPGTGPAAARARDAAGHIVLASAEACWRHRADLAPIAGDHPGTGPAVLPLFGHLWTAAVAVPDGRSAVAHSIGGATESSANPARDLSVQLSGWMLMEAAARLH